MHQKCETRAGKARASRNSCGGCFRDLLRPFIHQQQAIQPLIALRLGKPYLTWLANEGEKKCSLTDYSKREQRVGL